MRELPDIDRRPDAQLTSWPVASAPSGRHRTGSANGGEIITAIPRHRTVLGCLYIAYSASCSESGNDTRVEGSVYAYQQRQ